MTKANQLKRALNGLDRLRRDLRYILPMEMFDGMGNVVVRTYSALHQSVNQVLDDPLVEALVVDLPDDASDRLKVIQVNMLAGQLLSFVEDYYEMAREESSSNDPRTDEEQIQQRFNDLMDQG